MEDAGIPRSSTTCNWTHLFATGARMVSSANEPLVADVVTTSVYAAAASPPLVVAVRTRIVMLVSAVFAQVRFVQRFTLPGSIASVV